MKVIIVNNQSQLKDAYSVRMKVFVEEQKVPIEEEIDQFEGEATHFVVYDKHTPVGAGRLRELDGFGKVERICVDTDYRDKGVGKRLMEVIEEEGKRKGVTKFKLNAQTQATGFYSKLGYVISSGEFLDAGIPHVTMKKSSDETY